MRSLAAVVVVASVVASVVAPARAEGEWHDGDRGRARVVNIAVTAGLGGTVLASIAFRGRFQPARCRWCAPPAFDAAVRRALIWDDIYAARRISDVVALALPITGIGISLLPVLADGGGTGELLDVALPIAGTLAINQSLTQIFKLGFARTRPAIHFAETPGAWNAEDHVSFVSGHTSFAFAAATSAGMVARQRGSRYEPAIWAAGLTLAASVGYLRIAGDKHYLSDVLVGAVLGTATGLIVPTLMRHDGDDAPATTAPAMLSFGGAF